MSNPIVTTIPFNQLRRSAKNVRRSGRESGKYLESVQQLAASILATHEATGQGLLQNIVVHLNGEYYDVAAGGRRFEALTLLVANGALQADYPVSALVLDPSAVTAASLAENGQRLAMHPADEFDGFLELSQEGWTIDRIADSFGVTQLVVERRLKLRAAAPQLFELFRSDVLSTDQLVALCSTDNHEKQIEVWSMVKDQHWQQSPATLRRLVLSTDIDAGDDKRVAYIGGVEVYEQAGGKVRRDLFATDGKGVILENGALLHELVMQKLNSDAEVIKLEGWDWVEVWPEFDWSQYDRLGRAPVQRLEHSAEILDRIVALRQELSDIYSNASSDDDNEDRACEIRNELDAIEEANIAYSPSVMLHSGVVVSLQHGKLRVDRGMVRKADRANLSAVLENGQKIQGGRETESAGRKADSISDALRRSLLGHRNLAAQFMTAKNPKHAKTLLACKFITDVRGEWNITPSDLVVHTGYGARTGCTITDEDGKARSDEFDTMIEAVISVFPKDHNELWEALLKLSDADLDILIAHSVARSVSLSENMNGLSQNYVQALGLDMADHFQPSAGNYFGRVSKELVIEAISEAEKLSNDEDRARLLGMKKGQLAAEAEKRMQGIRWVPKLIRTEVTAKPQKRKSETGARSKKQTA